MGLAPLLSGVIVVSGGDLVVLQLVRILRGRDHAQVIAKLLLLEVALRQVLQLALREAEVVGAGDGDLRPVARDDHVRLGEVAGLALDLDPLVEVLLEGGDVEDLVVDGGRAVDDELDAGLLSRCLYFRLACEEATRKKVQFVVAFRVVRNPTHQKEKGTAD